MRRSWIGLIAFAACYQPTIQPGVPCSTSGACPDGQTCVAMLCVSSGSGTPPDAPPGGTQDRDADGIPDARDNCPTDQNADQLNEDGDGLGDVCDRCAHVLDDGKDGDGDGVPDACDPSSTTADTVWLFEGFHGGAPAWPGTSNWAAAGDGDHVRVTAAGVDDEFRTLQLPPRAAYNNVTFQVAFTVDSVSTNGPALGLSLYDNDTDVSVDCELFQNGNNAGDRHLGLFDDVSVNQEPALAWQTGAQYTLTAVVRGGMFSCSAAGPGGPKMASGTSQVVVRDGSSVDLWAYRLTARIDWLFVVGTP